MTKNEKIILSFSVFSSFFYRLYIILHTKLVFGLTDDAIYASLARFFLAGKLEQAFHPTWAPLYPLLMAIIYPISGSWERSAQIIPALAGSLFIIPTYFFAKKFLSQTLAFIFAFSSSLLLVVFGTSLMPLSDMLSTLLLVSAITNVIYGLIDKNQKYFYLASFFFGLTYLARSEGFMFFALTFAFLVFWLSMDLSMKILFKRKDKKGTLRRFIVLPISIFIFLLTISPYWIATKSQTGSWSLSQKAAAQIKQGHSFQLRNGTTWSQEIVSITSPNYASEYFKDGLPHILEYSDWYGFWFIQKLNVWKNMFTRDFPIWSIALMIIGIISILIKKDRFWATLFVFYIISTAVPITIFATPLSDPRYLLWVFPTLLLLIFIGIQNGLSVFLKGKYLKVAVVFCLMLIFTQRLFDLEILKPLRYAVDYSNTLNREEILAAGKWLKENTKNPVVMMKHEGVEFYSEGKTVYVPQDISLDEVIKYGSEKGAQYFIAWEAEVFADKNLNMLLDENYKNNKLDFVFKYPKQNPRLLIYKIK